MPPAVDVERVRADAREITASYTRVDNAAMGGCLLIVGFGVIGAAFAAGETGDNWVEKIVHGIGYWFLAGVVGLTLYGTVDTWAKSRACRRFTKRFPEGGTEREEAIRMLSGYSEDNVSERAFLEALGVRIADVGQPASPVPDAAVQDALAKLEPPAAWPPDAETEETDTNEPGPARKPPASPTPRGGVIPLRPDAYGDDEED